MPRARSTKTAFILSLPSSLPAASVAARGRKRGLQLTPKYVTEVRYKARRARSKLERQPELAPSRSAERWPLTITPTSLGIVIEKNEQPLLSSGVPIERYATSSAELELAELALQLGFARSSELLARARAAARELAST